MVNPINLLYLIINHFTNTKGIKIAEIIIDTQICLNQTFEKDLSTFKKSSKQKSYECYKTICVRLLGIDYRVNIYEFKEIDLKYYLV